MAKYVNLNEVPISASEIEYQVCIFCLKRIPIVKSEFENASSNSWQNFLKFWKRFVETDVKLEKQFESSVENRVFNCCDDCLVITASFCETYHQLKILEMNLEWKLDSLLNIVKLANKIPSRIREMREVFEQSCQLPVYNEDNDRFNAKNAEMQVHEYKVFRYLFTEESKRKLDQSKPRVLITGLNQKIPFDNNITVKEEIVNDEVTLDESCQLENDNYFSMEEPGTFVTSFESRENVIDVVMGIQIVKEEVVLEDTEVNVTGSNEDILPYGSFQEETSVTSETSNLDNNREKDCRAFSPRDKKRVKYNKTFEEHKDHESDQDLNLLEQESQKCKTHNHDSFDLNELLRRKFPQTKTGLKCANCPSMFYKQEVLDEHQKLHVKGTFKCQFCEKVLTSVYKLSQHESQNHAAIDCQRDPEDLQPVFCARCPFKNVVPLRYYEHFAEDHFGMFDSSIGRGYVKCKICYAHPASERADQHFKLYHDTTNVEPSQIERCKEENCSAFFVITDTRSTHIINRHYDYHEKFWKLEDEAKDQLVKFRREAFTCKHCQMLHCSQSELENHMQKLHKNVSKKCKPTYFVCSKGECGETYNTVDNLRIHKTHHGTFKCNCCDDEITYAPDLAIHEADERQDEKEDNPEYTIRCTRCNYKSVSKSSYIRHFLEKHLKLETVGYFCIICQNKFACKENLKIHVKTIHGMELDDAMRTENVFQCNLCPESFSKSQAFVYHQNKIHLKNQNCPICRKHFSSHTNLRCHFKKSHPNCNINGNFCKYNQCCICHKRFFDPRNLISIETFVYKNIRKNEMGNIASRNTVENANGVVLKNEYENTHVYN